MQNKINWFPGHMKVSSEKLLSEVNNIDFFIEVVDSRAPRISSNKELIKIFNNKKKITIALKDDLSDFDGRSLPDILFTSIKNMRNNHVIINKINKACEEKLVSFKKKGYINPKLYGMIVGLPNIGKSSLINFLSKKNLSTVKNIAGVTRKNNWYKISENLYILDTPGIFFKNVENINDGYKLTLLNCINTNVVNKNELLKFAFNYFEKYYSKKVFKVFGLNEFGNYDFFVNQLALKHQMFLQNNEIDFDRLFNHFISFINSNKMFLFNYELDS